MRRQTLITIILISALSLLTGCTTDYDRDDIIDYVKNEVYLSDYTVSKNYKEIEDEEGYIDRLWTIKDNENNITFHVLDNYGWGMESVTNSLYNDYDVSVFISLYDKLVKKGNISFIKDVTGPLVTFQLLCNYKNKTELTACYESVLSYKEEIINFGYSLEVPYIIGYDYKLKSIGDYEVGTGDKYGLLSEVNEEVYKELIYNYYSTALTFQIEDVLLEMSMEDKEFIMNHDETHRIYKTLDNNEVIYYDNVIAHEYYYGISFGGLYKILESEGFNISGSPWHYTILFNSDVYEFSYDFNDFLYEEEDKNYYGYYYKKNGEKIKMGAYFYNCLRVREINEMFGLNIDETANKFIGREY